MVYTVQRGDTLGTIAAKYLGSASKYKDIVAANPQITNPNLIEVGQRIVIPEAKVTEAAPPVPIVQPKQTTYAKTPSAQSPQAPKTTTQTPQLKELPKDSFGLKIKDYFYNLTQDPVKLAITGASIGLLFGVIYFIRRKK